MLKKLIQLADHLDRKGLHEEASFVDNMIAAGKPTETNRNSWRNGRAPDLKNYQCHDCGKDADKFFSYGRNDKYTAVCNTCQAAFERDNPPERFR